MRAKPQLHADKLSSELWCLRPANSNSGAYATSNAAAYATSNAAAYASSNAAANSGPTAAACAIAAACGQWGLLLPWNMWSGTM